MQKILLLLIVISLLFANQSFTQELDDSRLIELQTEYQKLMDMRNEINKQLLRLEGRFNERIKMIERIEMDKKEDDKEKEED